MNITNLKDTRNMLLIADCSSNPLKVPIDVKLQETISISKELNMYIYHCGIDMIITFTAFEFGGFKSGLTLGSSMIFKQDLVSVYSTNIDYEMKMNRFFYELGNKFADLLYKIIGTLLGSIYITGIGTAGTLAHSLYYFISNRKKDFTASITTFGSPRIGDNGLFKWFSDRICNNYLHVYNYSICGKYTSFVNTNSIHTDPWCLFPSSNNRNYVNNINLILLYKLNRYNIKDTCFDQPDMDIKFDKLVCSLKGLDSNDLFLWDNLHRIDKYWDECGPPLQHCSS